MDIYSDNKVVKGVRCGVRMRFGDSIGWCVDSGDGSGVKSDYETTFGHGDEYLLGYYVWSCDGLNYGKPVVSLPYKSTE